MQILQGSNGATLNGGNYFEVNGPNSVIHVGNNTKKGKGIKKLLDYVQREAIHDSSARGDLGCHPGTREEYIREITSWGKGQWESEKQAFLMTGPAGAGKSAIARDCAHKLKASGNLGASFFFYRPSLWNDPTKFIPTIVYQLTTQYSAYHDCIDAIILDNPLVLEKELKTQFLELLVKPLFQPGVNGHNVETGLVIVVDGLDECTTVDAQLQIIHLITTSIHERTTPFLWAFFSRPEPPITSAFSSGTSTNTSWTLPLTLSDNADSDIKAYLHASFNMIRAKHNIPQDVSWPEDKDICCLVSQSAGLFVYAATAVRYIDGLSNGRAGVEERLRMILQVDLPTVENPFSALDQLYMLLMMQIPEGILPNTLLLLHLDRSPVHQRYYRKVDHQSDKIKSYCLALGLSTVEFHAAISNLYSVLQVIRDGTELSKFQLYHRSFLDFLVDEKRCKQYFIHSPAVTWHCLERVICTLSYTSNTNPIPRWSSYAFALHAFFTSVEQHVGKLEESILRQISQVAWKNLQGMLFYTDFPRFIEKIPRNWRSRIIRPSSLFRVASSPFIPGFCDRFREHAQLIQMQTSAILMPKQYEAMSYILGDGANRGFIHKTRRDAKYWTINDSDL